MDPITARADWSSRRDATLARIAEELVALAIEDFEHQVGPRGCGAYAGYKEANGELSDALESIRERVSNRLQKHYIDRK